MAMGTKILIKIQRIANEAMARIVAGSKRNSSRNHKSQVKWISIVKNVNFRWWKRELKMTITFALQHQKWILEGWRDNELRCRSSRLHRFVFISSLCLSDSSRSFYLPKWLRELRRRTRCVILLLHWVFTVESSLTRCNWINCQRWQTFPLNPFMAAFVDLLLDP